MRCIVLFVITVVAHGMPIGVQVAPERFSPADLAEMKAYRLSSAMLAKVHSATRKFGATLKSDPSYEALIEIERQLVSPVGIDGNTSINDLEDRVMAVTPIAAALVAHSVTPREYVTFVVALVQAFMENELRTASAELVPGGVTIDMFGHATSANLKFVSANRRAVKSFLETMEVFTK